MVQNRGRERVGSFDDDDEEAAAHVYFVFVFVFLTRSMAKFGRGVEDPMEYYLGLTISCGVVAAAARRFIFRGAQKGSRDWQNYCTSNLTWIEPGLGRIRAFNTEVSEIQKEAKKLAGNKCPIHLWIKLRISVLMY